MKRSLKSTSITSLRLLVLLGCIGMATSPTIASGQEDPLVSISYGLEVEGELKGFFAWVEGIGSESEVVEHRIIDPDTEEARVEKVPGQLSWSGIALTRGITSNLAAWEWRKEVENGDIEAAMSDISIVAYDQSGTEITRWDFENAWPSKISAPEGSSTGSGVETLTIVHFPTDGIDKCPDDPFKTEAGACGCGVADTDSNNDGSEDCKPLIMRSGFESSGIPSH